jgi:hypothetical protein
MLERRLRKVVRGMGMRFSVLAIVVGVVVAAGISASRASEYPACAVQQGRDVGFRSEKLVDVLEVAIGPGPCHTASFTIILRTKDDGAILYSYVAPLRRHIGVSPEDPEVFMQRVKALVDEVVATKMGSTRDLPPWPRSDAERDAMGDEILISKQAYEALRAKPRPMFEHANHYEGWQTIIYDEMKEESVVILRGGA